MYSEKIDCHFFALLEPTSVTKAHPSPIISKGGEILKIDGFNLFLVLIGPDTETHSNFV